jgi:hypothetical protein
MQPGHNGSGFGHPGVDLWLKGKVCADGGSQVLKLVDCVELLTISMNAWHYNGVTSDPFSINKGIKQGCLLAPILFGIFFSMLLTHV